MTAALTQLKKAVASTQHVNRGHLIESIVMLNMSTVLKCM